MSGERVVIQLDNIYEQVLLSSVYNKFKFNFSVLNEPFNFHHVDNCKYLLSQCIYFIILTVEKAINKSLTNNFLDDIEWMFGSAHARS